MDNWYEHFASDHRGRPLHAGKRTNQGLGNLDYVNKPMSTNEWMNPYGRQDGEGPAMTYVPRKTPPKGPKGMGAAKGY